MAEAEREGLDLPITRIRAAVAMHISGASYTEIAEVEGYASATVVRRIVEQAIAATIDDRNDLPRLRAVANARLERLLRSVWVKANDSDPKNVDQVAYSRTALALIDRMIRLHGLDAPTKVEVFTPSTEEKERWLRRAIEEIGGIQAVEREADDIMDAEVVGDDDKP